MAMGHLGLELAATRCPAVQAGHVGLGPSLIDEDQACGVKVSLMCLPAPPLAVDVWLDHFDGSIMRDRRNGTYRRCLLSELGDIELNVPRTRHFCPTEILRGYARRAPEIDRAILAGFVLGLSTRKVGEVLLALLGRPVSAATVSRVAKTLDATVAAFHRRPLRNAYKALMLDGAARQSA